MVRLATPPTVRQPALPGMPAPDPRPAAPPPPAPAPRKQRRPSKHELDPRNQYIRRVKGGKWQVRPYCPIVRERYELGELFDDIVAARRARDEFWAGKRPDAHRFTRRVHTREGERFFAVVVVPKALLRGHWAADQGRDRETISLGPFLSREEAGACARGVLAAACGPLFAAAAVALRGKSYRKAGQKVSVQPPGQPPAVKSTHTDQPAA